MVKSVDFAVRDSMGGVTRGVVAGDGARDFIQVGAGDDISLNLRRTSILKYLRDGDDLQVLLVDGRTITLSGFYHAGAHLYISADSALTPVVLEEGGNGVLYADYGHVEMIGKWSPNDQLAFFQGDDILAPGDDDTTGMAMFAPLAGLGGLGLAGAGLVGLGLLGGGGDGGNDTGSGGNDTGSGGDQTTVPTVDHPDETYTLTTNTADPSATVSGTGETGSTVTVVLGDQTLETTVDADGQWSVTFEGSTFPSDGDLTSTVSVTAPDGTVYELDGPDFVIDMIPPEVEITAGAESTGDVENLAEYQDGVSVSGTGEVGAAITVEVAGQTQSTTVGADGSWSVTFTTDQLPPGEYSEEMTVTATDAPGNVTTITDTLVIDTVANAITVNTVAGDDVINAAEQAAGVVVSGTSVAGAVLAVTMEGVTQQVTTGTDGSWSVTFAASELPTGSYETSVTVTSTDAAGNVSTVTHAVTVDTEATVAFDGAPVTADDLVNAAEAQTGFVLAGTSEPGSTSVILDLGGVSYSTTPAADGSWSVTLVDAALTTGIYTATVTAIDAAGNSATATALVTLDTEVTNFTTADSVTDDNIVNGQEAEDGFVISGTVEPGAAVTVALASGAVETVTAGDNGIWSITFDAGDLSGTSGTMDYEVTAVDVAGNSATASGSFDYDLVAPESPDITAFTRDAGALLGIRTDVGESIYEISAVNAAGAVTDIGNDVSVNSTIGYANYNFYESVPNGSYLVVTDHDLAGNESSTLLVVDNTSAVTVDLTRAGLGDFDFGSIDLTFAPQAQLTITEEQVMELTGADHTLVISGDALDHVTAVGAQDSGNDTVIGGESYSIYTLGTEGATLVIDDDITNLTI
ncbi:Ig-like domain-containing protein [Rhodobacter maris]|uniref:Ig-like domain-containing protein n=1 Tax=Rhodobacter maris TaxID=446682 RepID=A0A285RM22_9RHOB|nr:Ig-like domain-containing protein [Rhodobacter maris]SOB95156.1 Ig-like domain-containing protein [Rhodobacter maris]